MDLQDLRRALDQVDGEITALFCRRMELSSQVGRWKREAGVPMWDPAREGEKLESVSAQAWPELAPQARALYRLLFALSRGRQAPVPADLPAGAVGRMRLALLIDPAALPALLAQLSALDGTVAELTVRPCGVGYLEATLTLEELSGPEAARLPGLLAQLCQVQSLDFAREAP